MQDNFLIELHSHILPGMDDGSPNVNTSLAMLRCMAEQGIGKVCATSHYYVRQNNIETFCNRRRDAMNQLTAAVAASGEHLPQVLPAAEAAYFPRMEEQDLTPLCIQGTRTLMLEMPFSDWTDLQVEAVTALALDRQYHVVLVHPERFCFSGSNRSKLRKLAALPIRLQVNAGSLIRWQTRRLALELLQMAQFPLLGSDCHNLTNRRPNLKEGREVIRKKLGESFLRQMDENAGTAVQEWEWSS